MLRPTSPANVRSVSNRYSLLATIVLATLTLTACGGGGGGDSSPPPASPANPPTPPPPPPAANNAPVAEAGAAQTITLPTNAVDLAGSATDADSNPLTYAWTSDPATGVTFADAAAAATRVTFTDAGTYTLTLTANDGTGTATATGTDTVQVIVNARPILTDIVFPGPEVSSDPNHGWAAVDPADVGMSAAKLDEAQAYALTGGGAGLISRRGRLVRQWGDIDDTADVKSTTKSIGGIALALAIDDSLLTLNDLAQSKLPTIGTDPTRTPPFANDPTKLDDITILQLATHTAGFEKDRFAWVPLKYTPGSTWSYSDGSLNWLADVLTTVFQRDLKTMLAERVWTPIGINAGDLSWRDVGADELRPPVPNNIKHRELASGMDINANAMARVGLLYLRKGMWNGTRIISESSVQLASTPRPELATTTIADPARFPAANANYAVLWWTNATKQLPNVPADAYWAWGLGDSLIAVIPSLDLVIARVGSGPSSGGPFWRSAADANGKQQPIWDGNYQILDKFLTPIAQSVTAP